MIVGFVAAKDNSNRFLGKNKFIYQGKPLFWHSVEALLESKLVNDIYVITDSLEIQKHCEINNVKTIWRPKNATRNEDKLISILRYGYYNLDTSYNKIVSIMANCPGHTGKDIDNAIEILEKNNLKEVRSFDNEGKENGIMVLTKDILENNYDISYYIGSINTQAKEIHHRKELK